VTLNTERYRAILAAGDDLTLADCHDLLDEVDRLRADRSIRDAEADGRRIVALKAEVDRLRAVIRETCGPTECEVSLNHHGIHCKLYEIEP
jgi:hypothetical protein